MRTYVITMLNTPQSVEASERCIESAKKFGLDPEIFPATTPDDGGARILKQEGLKGEKILVEAKDSRVDAAICCFVSHYYLWKKCLELNEEILCLEHDAVVVAPIPTAKHGGVCNLGRPSYGHYVEQGLKKNTMYKLFSKPGGYFPGTHAVLVAPAGAEKLIAQTKKRIGTPDLFLNKEDFPFLTEYYPWPVVADDSFTTVQNQTGCLAKHNYQKGIEII